MTREERALLQVLLDYGIEESILNGEYINIELGFNKHQVFIHTIDSVYELTLRKVKDENFDYDKELCDWKTSY